MNIENLHSSTNGYSLQRSVHFKIEVSETDTVIHVLNERIVSPKFRISDESREEKTEAKLDFQEKKIWYFRNGLTRCDEV